MRPVRMVIAKFRLFQVVDMIRRDDRGATAVEYGLVLGLITLAAFAALATMADTVVGIWTNVAARVTGG